MRYTMGDKMRHLKEMLATFNAQADKNGNVSIEVGWFGDQKYSEGESIAGVMRRNEYGGVSSEGRPVPPRPFMRPMKSKNERKYLEYMRNIYEQGTRTGKFDPATSMLRLGLIVEGDLRAAIQEVTQPPLAPMTIEKRRERYADSRGAVSEKPLIDTGIAIASINTRRA